MLDVQGGQALLVSRYALDCQRYSSTHADTTWASCTLRSWLNSTFYSEAFTDDEVSHIALATLSNHDNPDLGGTEGGPDTEGLVFLLSVAEVVR